MVVDAHYRATNYKQGLILVTAGQEWSVMARYRATNWQQGILTERWLEVVVDGRLQGYKLATRNTD